MAKPLTKEARRAKPRLRTARLPLSPSGTSLARAEHYNRRTVLGVALPNDPGHTALPHRPDGYRRWSEPDIKTRLANAIPWLTYFDNDAATALGEAHCGTGKEHPNFLYIQISAGLGGGPFVDGNYYRGAHSRIGTSSAPGAHVQDAVSLSALIARQDAVKRPIRHLEDLTSTDRRIVETLKSWIEDAAHSLINPLIVLDFLMNPNAALLGSRLTPPLIERPCASLNETLAVMDLPSHPPMHH